MNWVDVTIACLACLFAWLGWKRGLINTDFRSASLVAGAVLAAYYYRSVADAIAPEGATWSAAAGFAAIFLGAYIVVPMIGRLAFSFVGRFQDERIDKSLGSIC